MAYYDTIKSFYRQELGVKLACHVKAGGYTEIAACGPYPDFYHTFDHSAFFEPYLEQAFRNALRRRARVALAYAKKQNQC